MNRRIKIKAPPIALVAVCVAASCSAASPATARREAPPPTTAVSVDEVPGDLAARITSSTQIADFDGDRVVVAGRYIQVDVRKRGAPTDEPVYRGHVAIELDDGHAIFLEPTWSETAIRSPSEIAAHEGKRVEAAGTLHARCPSPPEPAAAIISPCLVEVEFVRPLDAPLRETTRRRPTVQANQVLELAGDIATDAGETTRAGAAYDIARAGWAKLGNETAVRRLDEK